MLDLMLGSQLFKYYENHVPSMLEKYPPEKYKEEEVQKYIENLFRKE